MLQAKNKGRRKYPLEKYIGGGNLLTSANLSIHNVQSDKQIVDLYKGISQVSYFWIDDLDESKQQSARGQIPNVHLSQISMLDNS
jgi:hypothetical protein